MADHTTIVNYPVYLGVWTNWSRGGRISGSTITLSHRNGALLTAFLAIFVTYLGSRLWRISCFVIHQLLLSETTPQDGLYHQRQTTLRTTLDEKSALIDFIQILRAWYSKGHRPFTRLLPIIACSAIMTAGFSLASIFSSKISSSMGNEVLISSSECGTLSLEGNPPVKKELELLLTVYNSWLSERTASYANYAQRCYTNNSKAGDCSGPYIKKYLPYTVDQNATCPFKSTICHSEHDNIKIDTGYLGSQEHFGLNAPAELRYNRRVLTHCAPIKAEGYRKTMYHSKDKPFTQYFHGPRTPKYPDSPTYEVAQQPVEEVDWENFRTPSAQYQIE